MKPALMTTLLLACSVLLCACGSQAIELSKSNPDYRGAVLFRDHCSGCHTLSVVGADGSATSINNRLRNNGPNFNFRKENVQQVLYAIRNGGFGGVIMPENIVVGDDAQDVANFLAKYSGLKAPKTIAVPIELPAK
ncbi:MAG TPA: c-type cytochrome [Solirubrobacteraceae bacterium]|nr:c-type cytochrome [Solirubrobacteraceae bacterium]